MKKSVAVLGLGRYGISLAKSLYEMGADVLVADKNEDLIKEMADFCTVGICADLENEEEIKSLDIKNMDIVVCAMGRNLSASIMSVAVAKELGVPLVVAKSSSERLEQIRSSFLRTSEVCNLQESLFRILSLTISSWMKISQWLK